jgi:hypothetical protein
MKVVNRFVAVFLISAPAILAVMAAACSGPSVPPPGGQIVVQQSGGAGMLIRECSDPAYRSDKADYIIDGTVEKVESSWNQDKSSIVTHTQLRIDGYIKGTPFAANELEIVTPGGTVDGVSQAVEDQPIFHEGKKVRIYFERVNGDFVIVCGNLGVEER